MYLLWVSFFLAVKWEQPCLPHKCVGVTKIQVTMFGKHLRCCFLDKCPLEVAVVILQKVVGARKAFTSQRHKSVTVGQHHR